MKNIIKFIKNIIGENKYIKLKYIFIFLVQKIGLKKSYLKVIFNKKLGYKLKFSEDPETFNQKIQFRKTFDKNPLYILCGDKYRVREYVKEKIGEEYLVPLHLVTESLSKEQWEKLPNQFIAKANNNSGPVQIVTDKINTSYEKVSKELHRQLNEEYGTISMESYYDEIDPIITVEKLLPGNPKDYKLYCFNTDDNFKCFIQIIRDRNKDGYKANFYSENWVKLDFHLGGELDLATLKKPNNLIQMIEVARKLSKGFDYVRVDLYSVEGKIYFGELTFCPNSGLVKFSDEVWDKRFGEYWDLKYLG